MNPDLPSTPREEWEARLTALLLGELDPAEAASVRERLAQDPELASWHEQLRQTLELVRAASAQTPEPLPGVTGLPKMSAGKRGRLLEQLRGSASTSGTSAAGAVAPQVIPVRFDEPSATRPVWRTSRRRWLALAAVLVALLGMASFFTQHLGRPRSLSLVRLDQRPLEDRVSVTPILESRPTGGGVPAMPPQLARRYGLAPQGGPAGEPRMEERGRGALGGGGGGAAGGPGQPPVAEKRFADFYAASEGRKVGALPVQNAPETMLNTMAGPRELYTQAGPSTTATRTRNVLDGFFDSIQDGTKPNVDAATPADPTVAGRASSAVAVPELAAADKKRLLIADETPGEPLSYRIVTNPKQGEVTGSVPPADAPAAALLIAANGAVNFDAAATTFGGDFALANRSSLAELPAESRPDAAKDQPLRGMVGDSTRDSVEASAPATALATTVRPAADQAWSFRANDGMNRAKTKEDASAMGRTPAPDFSYALQDGNGRASEAESKAKADDTLNLGLAAPVELKLAETEFGTPAEKSEAAGGARGAVRFRAESTPRTLTRAAGAAGDAILAKKVAQPAVSRFAGGQTLERESINGPATPALVQRELREAVREQEQRLERVATAPPPVPAPVPQPEIASADNAFSTFSLNVADVSFKLAGASLERGALPEPGSIRSEEFINALRYHDPEPAPGAPFSFAWDRAQYPFAHHRDVLRLSLRTAARGREAGRPLNLVLTLDASGSMERADRVQIVREALRTLAGQLRPTDRVSLVTFARTARLTVDALPGDRAAELVDRVASLTPEGGTNLEDALRIAYETALRHYSADGVNRVILFTDGAANLGDVQPESLQRNVESYRQRGVALDCFGIGWEGLNDDLLEVLSRHGDGRYGFLNSPDEAASGFVDQLAGALQVAAADVKVQVEFNPRRVTTWRQVGYARHQLKKEQFRDNTVDAAELGAAESGTALYVIETNPQGEGPLGVLRVRSKDPVTGAYREHEWPLPYSGPSVALEQASPALRLATASAAFAESLAGLPFAAEVTADRLLGYLQGVPATFQPDPRPARLEWMIRQAKSIRGN